MSVSFNPKLTSLIRTSIKMEEHDCVLMMYNVNNLEISFSVSK